MRITGMRLTPVAIADPPLRSSYGLHSPYALRTVVELESEDGITGISETHGGERILGDFERIRPYVVGRDAFDLARVYQDIENQLAPSPAPLPLGTGRSLADRTQTFVLPGENRMDVPLRVYSAIEVAALDLIGKSVGIPISELLGGRARDEVPFSAYLFYKHSGGGGEGIDVREDHWGEAMSPDQLVNQATAMVKIYGFKSIKLKAGVLPPDQEVETIAQLRKTFGPSVGLRIDPNCAWSVETSIDVAKRLEGSLEYLEDPVAGLDKMGELRGRLDSGGMDVPLASNVAVTSFADLPNAIRDRAVQIVLGDHHYWGGPRAVTELGRLCDTFDLGLSLHSNSHLGISLLAMTHVAAATRRLTYACDTHYPWQDPADEVLIGGKVPIVEGCVRVPTAPGLGAELDQDALARGKERYERCGYQRRDDEAEMRKHVDPSWRRVVPAW